MKQRLVLLLVLLASAALGAWLFRPAPPRPATPVAESCGAGDQCGSPAAVEGAGSSPTAPATPPPTARQAPTPAAPAPEPARDAEAMRAEAERLMAEGKVAQGIDLFRKAVLASPSPRNCGDFGALMLKLTNFDEAIPNLRRAAEMDPGNPDRWINLANAFYLKADPGKAWAAERKAREARPGLKLRRGPDGLWLPADAPTPP